LRWDLDWSDDADADLARIYVDAVNKAGVTQSGTAAEKKLQHDPIGFGTQKAEGLWYLDSGVLRIYYEIDETAHTVKIHALGELTIPDR
jgi:hypothetical protein